MTQTPDKTQDEDPEVIEMEDDDAEMESGEDEDDGDVDEVEEVRDDEEEEEVEEATEKAVYVHGKSNLAEDEQLVMDRSAYEVYHHATAAAPCLSFSIVKDNLGDNRAGVYPLTAYLVAGTQAEHHGQNHLLCMKLYNMHRVPQRPDDEEDSEESEEEDDEEAAQGKPKLNVLSMPHHGEVNRVRVQEMAEKKIAASWSGNGSVYLTDVTEALQATEKMESVSHFLKNKLAPQPFYKFTGHKTEGFGLDWSPVSQGYLASGDCYRNIHIWKPQEAGKWKVDERPLIGHTASVEDIQWSPNEPTVLASCSVDKSIRVFDIRANPAKSCMLTVDKAHDSDVNVISWNRLEQAFLVSGGDDGALKVWDFRQFKDGKPVSEFRHHKSPITSVEWHPTDSTVFSASSEDDCVTLWDLAVERDQGDDEENEDALKDLPPQLLFIHQGQQEVKECHWHPQMPGLLLSTAQSGFNIFRTISV